MKYFMIGLTLLAVAGFAFAQSYEPVTKDSEVETEGEVVVKETTVVSNDTILTLDSIDQEIAVKNAVIAYEQSLLADLQAQRAKVLTEAKKVTLKEVEEEEPKE